MTATPISQLPAATSSNNADLLVIVQNNVTKQITNANLFTSTALTTPILGTPQSGSLENCTNFPASSLTGLGTNVATFLGAPTSANLRAALTDETGTGAAVFASGPTLVAPILGAATATSINRVILTDPGADATFSLAAAKVFAVNNSFVFNGTDHTIMTFPSTDAILARTDAAQSFTGNQTFDTIILTNNLATSGPAPTITSAGTIAPITRIVFVDGTTAIDTITPPNPISAGGGQITFIPLDLWTTTTAGNIALATTAVVKQALVMTYDSGTAKWYPSY